jgi:hypothetical protein
MPEPDAEPNASATQLRSNQIDAYTFTLNKMITSLVRYADDGRAQDVVNYLKLSISTLTGEPYESDAVRQAREAAAAAADPKSPGVDDEGKDLAPFIPPQFPTEKGEFGSFGE